MLFTLVFGFAATTAFAQVAKYGKVNEAELQMTRFAQDTSAEAIVLSDYGYTRFSYLQGMFCVRLGLRSRSLGGIRKI